MNTQVNWQKIRQEFQRLTDVEKLRGEVHRIGQELRRFDFHTVLSPTAKAKVKTFEKRYSELMRTIHTAQRQMDREFNRILRQIQGHRKDMTKIVDEQKSKLEKVSTDLRKRFTKKAAAQSARTTARKPKAPTRKKTASRSTAKKRKA